MRIFCALLILMASQFAAADQFQMKNGDRITGAIQKSDGKTVILKTDYAGEITISLDSVTQFSSDQKVFVATTDGKTTAGTLQTFDHQLTIQTDHGPVSADLSTVTAMRSQALYTAEVERYEHPGWGSLWTGFVEAGLSLTTGNSETTNFAAGANASRITTKDKTSLYLATVYNKDSTTGESRTTANAVRWGGRYEYNLNPRLNAFGFTDLEHDEFQLLDLRVVLGGGLGWYFVKDDKNQFQIFGGASYNYENFSTDESRNSAELLAGEEWIYKLSDRVALNERLTFFPNMSETGEYRMTFDSGLITKLNTWLDWHITLSDRYISNPVEPAKKNDFLLTTGVRVSFQ